jgi:glutathione S-transferase
MSLTLYYHPLASYCHKVLIALYENDVAFEARTIDLGAQADREELSSVWPFCKFPVLRDTARSRDLPESSVIIEYLDHYFPGGSPLIPADFEQALRVRLWDRVFDNHVHQPMQDIVLDHIRGAKADMGSARAGIQTAYRWIDQHVASPWAATEAFSMADCAAAPALFYASTLEPLPQSLTRLRAYFDRLMDRASVQRVLAEARPYFHFYPFHDAIPAQFLS